MTRQMTHPWLLTLACIGSLTSCNPLDQFEQSESIKLDDDLRTYARQARAVMARVPAEHRAIVEPLLARHEAALRRFDRVMVMGQTRQAAQTPLLATGATLVLDNTTGVGFADDVLLPFVAIGLVAAAILTNPPASIKTRQHAYQGVYDSAQDVSAIMTSSMFMVGSEITSVPGDRQHCIDRYVDCQVNGRKSFPRSACQPCMDQCLGQGFDWPRTRGCDYK